MRTLERNKRHFYYALFKRTDKAIGDDRYRSGEKKEIYFKPVCMRANISPATGQTSTDIFGNINDYSKVIVTDDMKCPIDENSVLWIDTVPVFDAEGATETPHDYVVKHIAKSLNSISYAIDKVKKS